MNTVFVDHYQVLEIAPSASRPVIEAAYKAKIRLHHPDRGGDPATAQAINHAHDVLTDTVARADFDRERLTYEAPKPQPNYTAPAPAPSYSAPTGGGTATGHDTSYAPGTPYGRATYNPGTSWTHHAHRVNNGLRYTAVLALSLFTLVVLFAIHAVGYLYILGLDLGTNGATTWNAAMFLFYIGHLALTIWGLRTAARTRYVAPR